MVWNTIRPAVPNHQAFRNSLGKEPGVTSAFRGAPCPCCRRTGPPAPSSDVAVGRRHLAHCPGRVTYVEQMRETVRLVGRLREEHVPPRWNRRCWKPTATGGD